MKRWKIALLLLISAQISFAQDSDSIMFRRISDEVMLHGTCYDNLRVLCKSVGNRISGSPQAAKAVIWAQKAMEQTGADKVWLQPADVPHWVRGQEHLSIRYSKSQAAVKVPMLSLGNSVGTDGKLWEAPIVMVQNFDELKALPESAVRGKIVFFNYRFRQDIIMTFNGYGDAVQYRSLGPDAAAAKGAIAVIIRSVSTAVDDVPHTGALHYDNVAKPIPGVAIGNKTADLLAVACKKNTASAALQSECRMMPELVHSYNVIGEITGSEYPDQVIVAGGHLDSWDVGEGAHDDGAGCVQSIEILRTLKALGIRPKRTIRVVLFMNEENGMKGGLAYADSIKNNKAKHILAVETDAGGFSPRGFGLEMPDNKKERIRYFRNLFLPYGVYNFELEEGGTDISPLKKQGVPLAGLLPDPQRYFDIHHSNSDVFEAVDHRELKLCSVAMTQLVYLVSEYGL